jgi:hypothetical protein
VWRPKSPYGWMWRGFVGCGLAYVMALQLILSGLVVVSSIIVPSATHSAEHCVTSSGDDDSTSPGDHHAACRCGPACTMSACATIAGGLQAKATIAWPTTAAALQAAPLDPRATLPRAKAEGPHNARAPPVA